MCEPTGKSCLPDHLVKTVREMGWQGATNGSLLALAETNRFDVFMTLDQNLCHQQNVAARRLGFVVVKVPDNNIKFYQPLFRELNAAAETVKVGGLLTSLARHSEADASYAVGSRACYNRTVEQWGRMYLRRYTDMAALFYLLREQKITLLDPQSWDDRNDSHYLGLYKQSKEGLKSVLALCFTKATERYHFWRVFTNGSSGVRVRFRRRNLLEAVAEYAGKALATDENTTLRMESVKYLHLNAIGTVPVSKFPFVKRYAFQDEKEFRMVYESKIQVPKFEIPIPLSSCIDKIVLNPWLHPDLFSHVKALLHSIKNCRSMRIEQSKLIDNEKWKSAGEARVGPLR
jgi:hypothetical protein